jgi:lipid-A-disaccharide synthase
LSRKKIYIIAGEASGDLHASNLISRLHPKDDFECIGMGGELMKKAGVKILHDYREVNFMGFVDVIKNLRLILNKIKQVKKEIETEKPDAVLLVDYPGFNLRIAKHCKKIGIKVIYYISPQIWAWKQSRIKQIRENIDEMMTILPFEKDFYKKLGVDVHYVGHPLLDAIQQYNYNDGFIQQLMAKAGHKKIIALLPGSRRAEILSKLPVMIELADQFKEDYYFVIAGAPGANKELYNNCPYDVYYGETYNILKASYAALVTSGTATLETALHQVPQIVCYKTSEFNYQVGKRLAKVKYISLVNLILDKPSVTELIQRDLNIERLKKEFLAITGAKREGILSDYKKLIALLGDSGASARAAEIVIKTLHDL